MREDQRTTDRSLLLLEPKQLVMHLRVHWHGPRPADLVVLRSPPDHALRDVVRGQVKERAPADIGAALKASGAAGKDLLAPLQVVGTGFVYSDEGLIVIAAHVIQPWIDADRAAKAKGQQSLLPRRLREVLEEVGINQSEASRLSRVSFARINRMCTNATRRVDLDIINELCQTFEVEPGDLFVSEPEKRHRRAS